MKPAFKSTLLLCGLALATGADAATADDYAYAWPIESQGTGSAWQVELTPEVYAAVATADLRDVVVVNAAGEAVPSAAYRPPAAAVREELVDLPAFTLPATPSASASPEAIRLQIERGSDGKLRRVDADVGAATPVSADARHDLLLDASAIKKPLAALRVDWAQGQPDTTAQFQVDGSEDLQQWRTMVPRATVLRLTQNGNLLDRHDIALNNARIAYLRVHRIDDGAELQGFIVRARTAADSTAAHPGRQWLTAASDGADTRRLDSSFPKADGQHPIAYRYHLPAPLTIESLRLALTDDNSLARVHVLSRQRPGDEPNAWLQRANLVAFRLRQGDGVIDNDETPVSPAGVARDWRIESATPLEHAPTLSVSFTPDRLVFLAQGAGPYRLAAGSGKARRDDYPVEAALASLRASESKDWQPPLATLGARATLLGEPARIAAPEHTFDWKTWLLWAVLVGAAALIGGLALSLLKSRDEGRGTRGE
jgi:hypothetical protein